ncbi:MAG: membrane protein insertase YidC [Planctomycetota bacterium]|nr:MAG: membrane protein insertase YidC [Planctomycetota bacterium]
METKNLLRAMIAAAAVFIVFNIVYARFFPPKSQPTTPAGGTSQPAATTPSSTTQPEDGRIRGERSALRVAEQVRRIQLGKPGDPLTIELTSLGAAVETIRLTAQDKRGRYVHRAQVDGNDPYTVITPVPDGLRTHASYETTKLWITRGGRDYEWSLSDVNWDVVEQDDDHVAFGTTLTPEDAAVPWLEIRKTFSRVPDKPLILLSLHVKNPSDEPISVAFEQAGPIGIRKEHLQYDMRRVSVGLLPAGGEVEIKTQQGSTLVKKPDLPLYVPQADTTLLWTALSNKYFAVVTRPLPIDGVTPVLSVLADVAARSVADRNRGDLRAKLHTQQMDVSAGGDAGLTFEIYVGPKDSDTLAAVNPEYVNPQTLNYAALRRADLRSCCCSFGWLTDLMIGLLEAIHAVIPNYGIAIIVLVLIVRTLLHPLAVFQQKSMYRTQEAMGRIQPKMQAIKEKFANDKVRMNQEMMKLYSEENVNPAAGMLAMIPMFLQMPILIALWTGINTDLSLRHAPFDGWWIDDLSSPDALITFPGDGITIPVLGWLPLIGFAFQNIPSLNLLPILMGLSMWLQQKYMPKPHMEAKLQAAKETQSKGKAEGGMSIEDQLRQQQMMANIMAIMFPLMFYYMPSGLTLYWMATNVFGIFESLRIRKQIEREKQRRALEGPPQKTPREPGVVGRFLRRIAEQAEELQKKANELSDKPVGGARRKPRDDTRKKR